MHIGHFALTKYLLKLLLKPLPIGYNQIDAARIVNIASDAHMVGNFHPSLMSGSGAGDLMNEITDNCGKIGLIECCPTMSCPNTNGYARAKLANVMHAYELQRRVDEYVMTNSGSSGVSKKFRRLVTSSLHPGTVQTNISTFLSNPFTGVFLRSADQAAYVVLHALLDDSFVPSSYIDGMRGSHDLFGYQEKHISKHYTAFPSAKSLPFAFTNTSTDDKHTLHRMAWESISLVKPLRSEVVSVAGTVNSDSSSNGGSGGGGGSKATSSGQAESGSVSSSTTAGTPLTTQRVEHFRKDTGEDFESNKPNELRRKAEIMKVLASL